jgi:hypothetical protein
LFYSCFNPKSLGGYAVWSFIVYLNAALAGITAVLIIDYATGLTFRTGSILSLLSGWFLGYIILAWSRKRKHAGTAWAVFMFFFLLIPMVIFIFILTLNKMLHWQLPFGVLMLIYAAVLVVIFLLSQRVLGRLMDTPPPWDKTPKPDERDINLLVRAAHPAFIILTAVILLALLQPWLHYDDLRLWLGALAVGELFWFGSYIYYSYSKWRTKISNSFSLSIIISFLLCTLIMLFDYSKSNSINAGVTLAVLIGFLLGYMALGYLKRKPNFYWGTTIMMMLASFILPIMVILIAIVMRVEVPGWIVGVVWVLGLGIEAISTYSLTARLAGTDNTIENGIDERQQQHILWSSLLGFLALMIMLVFSLLQPWLSPGDTGLWLCDLTVGMTMWLLSYVVLETGR